jgi:PKD repeat protein
VSGGNGALRYSWDFDDGDFDYDNPTPTKSFPASGTYNVHLTVVDADGNHGQNTITDRSAATLTSLVTQMVKALSLLFRGRFSKNT